MKDEKLVEVIIERVNETLDEFFEREGIDATPIVFKPYEEGIVYEGKFVSWKYGIYEDGNKYIYLTIEVDAEHEKVNKFYTISNDIDISKFRGLLGYLGCKCSNDVIGKTIKFKVVYGIKKDGNEIMYINFVKSTAKNDAPKTKITLKDLKNERK